MKNYLVLGVLATGLVCWGMNSQAEAGHRHGGGGFGGHCAPSYGYGGGYGYVVPNYNYGYSSYGYAPRVRSYYGGNGFGGRRGFSRRSGFGRRGGFGGRGGNGFYLRSGNFAIGIR